MSWMTRSKWEEAFREAFDYLERKGGDPDTRFTRFEGAHTLDEVLGALMHVRRTEMGEELDTISMFQFASPPKTLMEWLENLFPKRRERHPLLSEYLLRLMIDADNNRL